jgi:hypothetical protein
MGLPPQYSQKSSANERASGYNEDSQEPFRPEKHSEEKEDAQSLKIMESMMEMRDAHGSPNSA